jgi:hypothetical protein
MSEYNSKYQPVEIITAGIASTDINQGYNVLDDATEGYVKVCDAATPPPTKGVVTKDVRAGDPVPVIRQGEAYGIVESALAKGEALTQTATGGFDVAVGIDDTIAYLLEECTDAGQLCKINMIVSEIPLPV